MTQDQTLATPTAEQGAPVAVAERKTPDYAGMAKSSLASLRSEATAAAAAELVALAARGEAGAKPDTLIVSTIECYDDQRAAWQLAARSPEFDSGLAELSARVERLAAEKTGKSAISAARLAALMAEMENPSESEPMFGETEFGVWVKREREHPGLRFMIGEPEFTASLSVLTREAWVAGRNAALAKKAPSTAPEMEMEIEPNPSPIVAPGETVAG